MTTSAGHLGFRRRPRDRVVAVTAGLAYLGLGPLAARDPQLWERVVFRAVNHDARGSAPLLRVPQQLGTPWLLPAMAAFAFSTRRPHLAVAAGVALPLEKAFEVGVKKIAQRRRPAQVLDTELHDDAPTEGPSYPSGHAALATCAAVLAAPYLPGYVVAGLAVATWLTTYTRVHQGAHFPLDAVGGVLLGASVGAGLNYTIGVPSNP